MEERRPLGSQGSKGIPYQFQWNSPLSHFTGTIMTTSFKVTLFRKELMQAKEVVVQAKDKKDAEFKALGLQQFPRKWKVVHVVVDATTMSAKFKHKGVRYNI
jgi:hypothetical protein